VPKKPEKRRQNIVSLRSPVRAKCKQQTRKRRYRPSSLRRNGWRDICNTGSVARGRVHLPPHIGRETTGGGTNPPYHLDTYIRKDRGGTGTPVHVLLQQRHDTNRRDKPSSSCRNGRGASPPVCVRNRQGREDEPSEFLFVSKWGCPDLVLVQQRLNMN